MPWFTHEIGDVGQRRQIVDGDAGARIVTALTPLPLEAHALEFVPLTATYPSGMPWFTQEVGDVGQRKQIVVGDTGICIVTALTLVPLGAHAFEADPFTTT